MDNRDHLLTETLSIGKGVVGLVSSGLEALGIGTKDDHKHQMHLVDLYNQYGRQSSQFTSYLSAWLNGVGRDIKDHLAALVNIKSKIDQLKAAKADATESMLSYNTYLKALVDGRANPMTPAMFGLEYYILNGSPSSNSTGNGTKTTPQIGVKPDVNKASVMPSKTIIIIVIIILVIVWLAKMGKNG